MMKPTFTPADLEEARRLNARLRWLPRFRMQTGVGRVVLNALLLVAELVPLIRGNRTSAQKTIRTIRSGGLKVNLRIFRPSGKCRGVILDLHGGGWTIGNARMSDGDNAALAERTSLSVVCVDYRLAQGHPLSAMVDDCEAAFLWTMDHAEAEFGTKKIIVKGSSAGAHLAALTMLRLRDARKLSDRVAAIVLYFGLYDFTGTEMVRQAGADNLILHGPTVRSTLRSLTPDLSDEERRNPSISPLYADLGLLPPALFLVGDKDMLLEDNEKMQARWQDANGNSTLLIVPESPHAFNRLTTAIKKKVEAYVDAWMLDRVG